MGGENPKIAVAGRCARGSSPRGRGKPVLHRRHGPERGLIPAWAGKTASSVSCARCARAHPRVGGENAPGIASANWFQGSSPRGRGKRGHRSVTSRSLGLIPAWAGKTPTRPCRVRTRRGSSPRGRGKRRCDVRHGLGNRLIPAWAGKTSGESVGVSCPWAHPRVGGENALPSPSALVEKGSSPRGRGKLAADGGWLSPLWLIPAWAGKTRPSDAW